jgi:hypothetical protein
MMAHGAPEGLPHYFHVGASAIELISEAMDALIVQKLRPAQQS